MLESIGDPTLTVALLSMTLVSKQETCEIAEVLRSAQRVIDLADGEVAKGNFIIGSPLATAKAARGVARWCMGIPGWKDDLDQAVAISRDLDPMMLTGVIWYKYVVALPYGVLLPDETALRDTAYALAIAEQSGDDLALDLAQNTRGVVLFHQGGEVRASGLQLLVKTRERALQERFSLTVVPVIDTYLAREKARVGDVDGALELIRTVHSDLVNSGGSIWTALACDVLVEVLLKRRGDGDLNDAQMAIEQLVAVPTDSGFVVHELYVARLRALLANARGDDGSYRGLRDRYRKMVTELGFEGHMAWAEAMP